MRLRTIMVVTKDMNNPRVHNHELKLQRAAAHLTMLDEQIDDWLDGAYHYLSELDPQSSKKHIRVKVHNPPPAAVRLLIGDCLHNFRSALDNLAYELAVEHQRGPLPERYFETSEFPIFKRPMNPDERRKKIGCIHPRAQDIIIKLQPYQHRVRYWLDPLWQLHQLNNVDKHRLPNIIQFATDAGAFFPDSPTRPQDLEVHMGPITDGRRVATYTPAPNEPPNEIHTEFLFVENLQFAHNTYMLDAAVSRTLHKIHSRIRDDVLPPLAPYLPDPEWFNTVMQ
jgi:hypothetical protein